MILPLVLTIEQFVQYLFENKDQHLIWQLVKKKYQVPITPAIKSKITTLYDKFWSPKRTVEKGSSLDTKNVYHNETIH